MRDRSCFKREGGRERPYDEKELANVRVIRTKGLEVWDEVGGEGVFLLPSCRVIDGSSSSPFSPCKQESWFREVMKREGGRVCGREGERFCDEKEGEQI